MLNVPTRLLVVLHLGTYACVIVCVCSARWFTVKCADRDAHETLCPTLLRSPSRHSASRDIRESMFLPMPGCLAHVRMCSGSFFRGDSYALRVSLAAQQTFCAFCGTP